MNTISHHNSSSLSLLDPQAEVVISYLKEVGLPFENIIAPLKDRNIIGHNLLEYLKDLPPEITRDAKYLSKFVIGSATGLFDYSLNSIWNEVVLSLRKKAITYGLDIFFDSAVSGK